MPPNPPDQDQTPAGPASPLPNASLPPREAPVELANASFHCFVPTRPVRDFEINKVLDRAVELECSDVWLKPGTPVTMKVNGRLERPLENVSLSPDEVLSAIYQLCSRSTLTISQLAEKGDADFARTHHSGRRFRGNIYSVGGQAGFGVALRLLPKDPLSLAVIGVPEYLTRLVEQPRGLILVCGPTGSGKTMTLGALTTHLAKKGLGHIVTIEDPIEFVIPDHASIVSQREVGKDARSFHEGLRAALREAPRAIVVGEMRDEETAKTAISAAETGHLVLATLHTTSTARTVKRILDFFPESRESMQAQFAEAISGILCQTLVPRSYGKGRVAAFEFLKPTSGVRNLIRQGKTQMLGNELIKDGNFSLKKSLEDLYARKLITREEMQAALDIPDQDER